MIQITPVILCGGSGTRLWPLSRTGFPKQFLCLTGDDSLFQQAARRLIALNKSGAVQTNAPLIVTGEEHRFLAQEQLREIGVHQANYLLEPASRNTAPALTLAALAANATGTDPVMVVIPADQTVSDIAAFEHAIHAAIENAATGKIVILGVIPDKPQTGYGYILADPKHTPQKVLAFVEKPDQATAEKYLQNGNYYWNAGMFVLKASVWLNALKEFRPDIEQLCAAAWANKQQDNQFMRPDKGLFEQVPSDSIDYAVIEKCPGSTQNICMVLLNAGWSDLGAWDSVWEVLPKDEDGNVCLGDAITINSKNNIIYSTGRLVSLVGVDNLVAIETPDAVLVANKNHSQEVKKIISKLNLKMRNEQNQHRKVYRPWGWYDCIDEGVGFKVKRILVKSGASLSLQKHEFRSEHWIVVSGLAEVTNGTSKYLLHENQSTYIPVGEIHRLKNLAKIPLEIIEVQTGHNLSEEDIIRFEDNYGRA